MSKKRIGIAGDSFAAHLPSQQDNHGWSRLLSQNYTVTNVASCGASEYRIWQTLNNQLVQEQDAWIVSHTSHSRVYAADNPLHKNTLHHQHCDVLFTDIEHRNDPFSRACQDYFRHLFDDQYHRNIHVLILDAINNLLRDVKVFHLTHFDYSGMPVGFNIVNYHDFWRLHRGDVNHYSAQGNRKIFSELNHWLQTI